MYGSSSIPIVLLSALATFNGLASTVFFLLRARLPEASLFFGATVLTFAWALWLCSCGLFLTAVLRRGDGPRAHQRPLPLRLPRRRPISLGRTPLTR